MSAKRFKDDLNVISHDRIAKRKLEFFIFQQRVHSKRKQLAVTFSAGAFAGVLEIIVLRLLC
jgi:hypothetical protein